MQTYKKKVDDKDGFKKHIIDNAMGNPIVLKAVPTNDTMKANTWGYYDDDIYIKTANNKTLKLTGTVVS